MTPAQLTALKAYINNIPALAAFPMNTDGYIDLAKALEAKASPNFWVWATDVDVQTVKDAIVWANLTPADAPDGTQAWANRSLQCQGKQFNLQLILPISGTMNGAKSNVRVGLKDALQGVRSGAGGATQNAGWAAVRNALARTASHVEKALADVSQLDTDGATVLDGSTRAMAAMMTFEGPPSALDVELARNLP